MRAVVLGIGNIILSDEAAGVRCGRGAGTRLDSCRRT
jgi:Ni,Fe-hydrogenase maturation factor